MGARIVFRAARRFDSDLREGPTRGKLSRPFDTGTTFRPQEVIWILAVVSAGILIRLIQISQPFVDFWCWRQTDVAMIAENFYSNGFNILYPQVNWGGSNPGYVGTEFQLVPFIAAVVYLIFGVQPWIGRSVSVFFFVLSVPFLYLLVKNTINTRSALFAVVFYTIAPLSIFSSRSFMPDMASLSLSIVAIYLSTEWLARRTDFRLQAALCVTTALSILVKLPAMVIGVPILYMVLAKYGGQALLQRKLWLYASSSVIVPGLWYAHAYLISVTHYPHHIFGSGLFGIVEASKYIDILRNTATSNLTPIVFALMIVGIILPRRNQYGRLFDWWLVGSAVFVILLGEGHSRHIWYQLPVTAVGSVFASMALDFLIQCIEKYRIRLLAGLAVTSVFLLTSYYSLWYVQPLYIPWALPSLKVGKHIDRIAPQEALLIVPGSGDPTTMYYAKRRGWHFLGDGRVGSYPATSELAIVDVENRRHQGAIFLVLTKYTLWYLEWYKGLERHLNYYYRPISDGQDYLIFDLRIKRSEEF
jgi:Dolichyl-phosphate-mannose-protein mannosyltransferase